MRLPSRQFIADTFALVSFAFAFGLFVEVVVSGLTLEQGLRSRLIALPLNIIVARPYGRYRDWLFCVAKTERRGRIARSATDIGSFMTFMIPQYAIVLWWVEADAPQILVACLSVLAISTAIGRPYGLYLVFCRNIIHRVFW